MISTAAKETAVGSAGLAAQRQADRLKKRYRTLGAVGGGVVGAAAAGMPGAALGIAVGGVAGSAVGSAAASVTDEDKASLLGHKIPLIGGVANQVIGKYARTWRGPLGYAARALGQYDAWNRNRADLSFSTAIAEAPKTPEERSHPLFRMFGYLTETGGAIFKTAGGIADFVTVFPRIGQGLLITGAFVTGGAGLALLAALPSLETLAKAAEGVSAAAGIAEAETGAYHLDYRAAMSQDARDPDKEARSVRVEMRKNTTDRVFALAHGAMLALPALYKTLNFAKHKKTLTEMPGFLTRAQRWIGEARSFALGATTAGLVYLSVHAPRALRWADHLIQIMTLAAKAWEHIKPFKTILEGGWELTKATASFAWDTALWGVNKMWGVARKAGGRIADGAHAAGAGAVRGARWAADTAADAAEWTAGKVADGAAWAWAAGGAGWRKAKQWGHSAWNDTKQNRRAITLGALGGALGGLMGGAAGAVSGATAGAALGALGTRRPRSGDGDMSGPFYPSGYTGARTDDPEAAVERGAIVFVNGIATGRDEHDSAARRIAEENRKPVVGVFNASGIRVKGLFGKSPTLPEKIIGGLLDVAQSAGDKFFDIGQNPATGTLVRLIRRYGAGLHIVAHSQGSIIVSEALRQARNQKVDLSAVDVTTYGNASWTFPAGPKYRHRVNDSDMMPALLGTASPISGVAHHFAPARWLMEKVLGGPIANAVEDTHLLTSDRAYSGSHSLNQPDKKDDYLARADRFKAAEAKGPQAFSAFQPLVSTVKAFLPRWLGGYASEPSTAPPAFPAPLPAPSPSPAPASSGRAAVQRMGGSGAADFALASNLDPALLRASLLQQEGAGSPVGPEVRPHLEGAVGFDVSGARLHAGPAAAQAAASLNAEAFTIGSDVFFGAGRYAPQTAEGRGLLAHELTHVGQQTGARGAGGPQMFSASGGDAMEQEAQRVGAQVRSGLMTLPQPPQIRNYAVSYQVEDFELGADDQRRLADIAREALEEARCRLTWLGLPSATVESVDAHIEIDLAAMRDAEAVDTWAAAIVSAVASASCGPSPSGGAEALQRSSASNGIQRSLGSALFKGIAGGLLIAGGGGALLVGAGIGLAAMAAYDLYRTQIRRHESAFTNISEDIEALQRSASRQTAAAVVGQKFGLQRRPSATERSPADETVAALSDNEKMVAAGTLAMNYVGPELRDLLAQIFTLENVVVMGAMAGALAAANLTPYGWVLDAVVLGYAAATVGVSAIDGLRILVSSALEARNANAIADLDAAAHGIAQGAVTAGVNGLMLFLTIRAARAGANRPAGNRPAAKPAESPAVETMPKSYQYNQAEDIGPLARKHLLDKDGNLNHANPALNFASGKYNEIVLEKPTVLYRAGKKGTPLGEYFTREPLASEIQARDMLAVKQYWTDRAGNYSGKSPLDTVFEIEVPAGTRLYEGPAAGKGGTYLGGGSQIYIEKPWTLKGVKVISERPLPHDSVLE